MSDPKKPVTLDEVTQKILAFRDARNWKQFHNSKDMVVSLVLEASELLEHFQWKNGAELEEYLRLHKTEVGEELADVLYWIILVSHDLDIDILETLKKKMVKNEQKYPVEKSTNSHKKYTEL